MASHGHDHDHDHEHEHGAHPHSHGTVVDPKILSSQRGIWALRWSFLGLFVTALIQVYVFWRSHSVALLADTIHNFGDAVRILDGVEAGVVEKMQAAAAGVPGVERVDEIRARWSGHRLLAEMNVAVASTVSVAEGHVIADRVRQAVHESIEYLDNIAIHVDPTTAAGEQFHKRIHAHAESDRVVEVKK